MIGGISHIIQAQAGSKNKLYKLVQSNTCRVKCIYTRQVYCRLQGLALEAWILDRIQRNTFAKFAKFTTCFATWHSDVNYNGISYSSNQFNIYSLYYCQPIV